MLWKPLRFAISCASWFSTLRLNRTRNELVKSSPPDGDDVTCVNDKANSPKNREHHFFGIFSCQMKHDFSGSWLLILFFMLIFFLMTLVFCTHNFSFISARQITWSDWFFFSSLFIYPVWYQNSDDDFTHSIKLSDWVVKFLHLLLAVSVDGCACKYAGYYYDLEVIKRRIFAEENGILFLE